MATQKKSLIDPLYQKYTKSVIRALGSTDFYEYFMDCVARAETEIQFSNRKMIKTVDLSWVDAVEETLNAFQTITSSPRNVITEEELIVNVANAKKAGSDVVRHLAQHASLVEKFDPDEGDVRPSKLMQKYREDSIGLYENRLVFTTMEMAFMFVKIRHDALFGAMSDEFGAKLRYNTTMESATEMIHMETFMHIKEVDDILKTDEKNREVFERISRAYRVLSVLLNTPFAQQLAKLPRVRGTITKTNVLKKNPSYKKIVALYDFLRNYDEIGYSIKVVEQSPEVNEILQRDIYHNVLFNYLVLKGYLEDEKDRQIPASTKSKSRVLKPKFIREIIEELTEDYDLPEVEIRKVLIEELTKEQLMKEEAAERRRLVEEQAQRKREEAERIRKEKEAERERIRKEKEAEKERLRQEKVAEEERLYQERMERETEERRRSKIINKELAYFLEHLQEQLDAREAAAAKKAAELQEFEDAVQILEEAEQRKLEAEEREKKRKKEERDRVRREKQLAIERAEQAERERLEQERLAREAEEERLRREADQRDTAGTAAYREEITIFIAELAGRKQLRQEEVERTRKAREEWERSRRQRLAARLFGRRED